MREKIRLFFRRDFVRDTATLQAGTLVSTALSFVASVIFARVLGPANYGQYALIFALTGLIGVFMNWGADYATITLLAGAWAKRDKEEIKNIVVFFIKICLTASLTVGLLAIIFSPLIAGRFYHNAQIGIWARWILIAMSIQFVFALLTIILQVSRKIKHLTVLENINKAVHIILPVSLVLAGLGLYGIVWGNLLCALFFLFFSFYFYKLLLKRTDLLPNFSEIIHGLKNVSLRKYFKFGFLIAVDKNLSNLFSVLAMTFLGMAVGSAEIGYFKIALAYIGLSLMLLGPVSRLLLVQLPKSQLSGHETLRSHFFKTAFYSFLIVLACLIPMLIIGKYLVQVFYGPEFLPSVKMIYMLWPYALIGAWGVGLGAFYRTTNQMKTSITINAVNLIVGAPIFYFLIKKLGTTGMIITTTSWLGVSIFVSLIYVYKYFEKHKEVVIRNEGEEVK